MSSQKPTDVLRVARRMRSGRVGIVEKPLAAQKPRLNKDDQLAQATAMMHERLFGSATVKALAERFDLDVSTVRKRLEMARQDGVPDEAREVFINQMLPMSMAVLLEALRSNDEKTRVSVALKIVDGLEAMKLPAEAVNASNVAEEETLELWRKRIVRRNGAAPSAEPPSRTSVAIIDTEAVTAADPGSDAEAGIRPPQPLSLPASGTWSAPAPSAPDQEDPGPDRSA